MNIQEHNKEIKLDFVYDILNLSEEVNVSALFTLTSSIAQLWAGRLVLDTRRWQRYCLCHYDHTEPEVQLASYKLVSCVIFLGEVGSKVAGRQTFSLLFIQFRSWTCVWSFTSTLSFVLVAWGLNTERSLPYKPYLVFSKRWKIISVQNVISVYINLLLLITFLGNC